MIEKDALSVMDRGVLFLFYVVQKMLCEEKCYFCEEFVFFLKLFCCRTSFKPLEN